MSHSVIIEYRKSCLWFVPRCQKKTPPSRISSQHLCTNANLPSIIRLYSNPSLAQNINEQRIRSSLTNTCSSTRADSKHSLVLLVPLHVLDVHVEQVGGIHGSAFRFGMELGAEDGAGFVNQAWVSQ